MGWDVVSSVFADNSVVDFRFPVFMMYCMYILYVHTAMQPDIMIP